MQTLREIVADAEARKVAVGHFNISDSEQLWGIFNAARELNLPVIIGTSEGERSFIGQRQAVALVKSLREEYDYPIYINADHTYSFEKVKEAIDAGYDAVIFDGSKVTPEENVSISGQCVQYARKSGREVLVEAELGNIGTSSKMLESIPEGAQITSDMLTKPDDLKAFVEETGVDLIAPAVGNLHGMLKSGKNPNIDIERVRQLRSAGGVPMVLHGGSGISSEDFMKAIQAGISIVHINTEIRVAYRKGIQLSLQENPDEIAPYRFMKGGQRALFEVVKQRLMLFNGL
ncbi:class II fructose-bisphosphate aldolase [Patescibacteria group bacterium]|nr:class II fructose-bisphosphate aldolase [Patescibacteria group bacterium]